MTIYTDISRLNQSCQVKILAMLSVMINLKLLNFQDIVHHIVIIMKNALMEY